MAATTTTTAAELMLAEIVSRFVYEAGYIASKLRSLVHVEDISNDDTLTAKIPKWPDVSASVAALTEGADLTDTAIDPTSVSVSVQEHGLMFTITDLLRSSTIIRDLQAYAEQGGMALGQYIDTKIAAEFANFTNSVGSSGIDLTEADFLAAIATLESGNVATDVPLVAVLHSVQVSDLRTALVDSTGAINASVSGPVEMVGRRLSYMGVPVVPSNACALVNAGADRQGAMFPVGQAAGVAYVEKWGARTEFERDASKRGTEIVITAAFGTGTPNPAANGGVKIVTDA